MKKEKKGTVKKWGGARPGAGRKFAKSEYGKEPITKYIEKDIVAALGGREAVQGIMYEGVVRGWEAKR